MIKPSTSPYRSALYSLALAVFAALAAVPLESAAAARPDANLFTTFSFDTQYKYAAWIVCGSTSESEGCYASGRLGPFGRIGAIMEGTPFVNGSTVTRAIYVVDVGAGATGNEVKLHVYKKTDVISSSDDAVTVGPTKSLDLSLVGGYKVTCYLAASGDFLYVGTNQSQQALQISKSTFSIAALGGFSPPINLSAITTDSYGNVVITFGDFLSGSSGFYAFDADGSGLEDGGGADVLLNTDAGLSTASLPPSNLDNLASRLVVRPKPALR
jgi:hypothetical protein